MKRFVQSLTNDFLAEAKSSPWMFEDLAAMEHYMAESYDGRTFVEILQNADDASATALSVFSCGSDFVIANNGRPFNQEDLIAICRSGASSKRRGSGIGYRGIGFKSATSISSEIVIYSSGVFFTFSKSRCAKEMNRSVDRVPTVRIPFLVDERNIDEELLFVIDKYEKKGYTTFFIFKNGNKNKLLAELTDISSGWLLFLNHIESVSVDIAHLLKKVEIKRRTVNKNQYLFTDKESSQSWLIVYGGKTTAIAFKYDEHIVPCNSNEALFHCYLPTLDSLGYPFKANADFSTDPSRKHIIFNEDDTKRSILEIAQLVVELLSNTSFENQPYLIDLLATRSGISEASSFLDQQILALLKTYRWIPLQGGIQVTATEHKIIPSWFDSDSRKKVFKIVTSLGNDEIKKEVSCVAHNMDDLLLRSGCQPYALRSVFYSPSAISSFLLKDKADRIINFSSIQEPVDLSEEFLFSLKGILNSEELIKVSELPAFSRIVTRNSEPKKKRSPEKKVGPQKKIEYSKWKTPIQNCMVSEQLQGRSPKDVSKKIRGYDIESTEIDGTVRYFSVKPVEILGNSFVLSEKEYSFAERHGSNYGIYIIESDNPENNMLIEGINSVKFEKRVREWEWVSGKYEVTRKSVIEESSAIDSQFLKDFSLSYLNKIQVAFLKTLCNGGDITDFESEFSCKASSVMMQVNNISDFYLGDTMLEKDLTVKGKYLGALKYMIKQAE